MRILAVDDDPMALGLVEATLRSAGYADIVTTTDSRSVVATVVEARTPFDCFLLDIQMPGVDGIELCGQIRQIAAHRRTPILMITAVTDRAYINRAFTAGATDYVNKPFDPLELVVRIGVAEQMSQQDAIVRASQDRVDFLRNRLGLGERIQLDDAFALRSGSGVVGLAEIENHILRMPKLRAWRSRSLTLRIDGIEDLHADLPAETFYDLVSDVGQTITKTLKLVPHVVGYVGGGTFVILVDNAARVVAGILCDEIQARLRTLASIPRAIGLAPVTVSVDPPRPIGDLLSVLTQRSMIARQSLDQIQRHSP